MLALADFVTYHVTTHHVVRPLLVLSFLAAFFICVLATVFFIILRYGRK